MKLLSIKEIFTIKDNTKYYTFRKAEHEMILLKKLENNKIFYNNAIYDQNFFYYHKLEGFMEQIYELRDDYINFFLNIHFRPNYDPSLPIRQLIPYKIKKYKKRISWAIKSLIFWRRNRKNKIPRRIIKFIDYDPNNCDEITGLVKEQYDVLVTAYKYEFDYLLPFDLLNPKIRYPRFYPYDLQIRFFFYDWFYILGWKSIKPVYPTFSPIDYWRHYDDDIGSEAVHREVEESIDVEKGIIPDVKDKLTFRNNYSNPLDAGTRFRVDWIEEIYDEQKKFSEFDINCKTNSYYTRYIAYNEIYHKFYPEDKKFKTDLIHDFTEEEINENYENMIDKEKTALSKFNFIMFNEKRKTTVLKFFEELEIIEVSREKLIYDFHWNHEEDSDMWLNQEVNNIIHDIFNNPRYLLIMPLVDAYFEVFRSKGFYFQDESFLLPPWTDTGAHKKLMKHLMYFDFSYERQYMFAEKLWLIDDYMDLEDVECDEHYEDEFYALNMALGSFIWLVFLNFYILIFWFFKLDMPFQSSTNLSSYYANLKLCSYDKGQEAIRQLMCPEIYYGLEIKRPRSRIRTKRIILPLKFHEPGYYSYTKKRASNMLPFSIFERICFDLDEKDFGLNKLNYELVMHGRRHLIWKLRVPLVEYRYPWTDADPSPIQRFIKWEESVTKYVRDRYLDERAKKYAPYIWRLRREYEKPVTDYIKKFNKVRIAAYHAYKQSIIDFLYGIKQSIIDFFKKPTN